MYILRDYQEAAVSSGVDFLKNSKKGNALQVLPTGSGKSLIISNLAKELNGNVLVFQPSKEILKQNFEKLLSYDPFLDAKVFSASLNSKEIGKITFATIGSAINKPDLFKEFEYIIIDEAHFVNSKEGMYKRFLQYVGKKRLLGLTATPYRLNVDGYGGAMLKFITRTNPRVFTDVIYHAQIGDLQNRGFLTPTQYYRVGGFDTSKLVVNSTLQDYTDKSIKEYYQYIKFEEKIADVAERLLKKRKNVLIFTKFVEEAVSVQQILGDKCGMVSANTPAKERDEILRKFKAGEIVAVVNVGVLTTGFDFPELETILLARTTRSMALYYQMIGRSSRVHPSKENAWVVDMCGSFDMFGRVENFRLENDGGNQWYYTNGIKRLTNVYLD